MRRFQAGQNLSLSQQHPGLTHIDMVLYWAPSTVIVDASAFALTVQGQVRNDGDFIFYNQPALEGGAITLDPSEQRFSIRLDTVPPHIDRIALAVTVGDEGSTFAALQSIRLEVQNTRDGEGVVEFLLETRGMLETAVVLGDVYRRGDEWKFRAVGQGYVGGLEALARSFGVDVGGGDAAPSETNTSSSDTITSSPNTITSSSETITSSSETKTSSQNADSLPSAPPPTAHSSDQTALAARCQRLAEVSAGFVQWLDRYPDRIGQEKAGLVKEFRRFHAQAQRLRHAVERPMCVGVFGPSQSGKSYLISALARKGTEPLMARFGQQTIDFIRDINPEGGRESTGLVTRFTLKKGTEGPSGAPVRMRLLTQTDLVKVIGNTYYSDCDHSDDVALTPFEISERLNTLAKSAQAQPVDPLNADAVYDLQAYFERHFKGVERVRLLRHGYWEQAAELAPRLRIADRAQLFGLIWGDVPAFNQIYIRLYSGLQGLGFAAEACAGLEALLPREQSIIDVQTLKGLGEGTGQPLTLVTPEGARVTLPRNEVTALIAELRIEISEQPWDFFQETDLLDFPGARSREQVKDLPAFLQGQDALQGLFLRGKVAYLFDRYCAEQELTSMLLCIGPSNQEVKTLPEMVNDWIVSTHGATPEQRAGQPTALFLVLTKFDMEFEEKAGERSPESRWITRMESSLLNFFGKQHDWPRQWDGRGVFRNSYWLRNPNFKAKNIFDYDEDSHELGVRPGERKRIGQFKAAFLNDRVANAHFEEPEVAWEAGFALNDGGVRYLAEHLRPVCNPLLKAQQLAAQATRLEAQLAERMGHYHISDDPEQELQRRMEAAQVVAGALIDCAGAQRFGELLAALQVRTEDLERIYYQIETAIPDAEAAIPTPTVGATVNTQQMKARLGLLPTQGQGTAGTGAATSNVPARKDDAARFAAEVLATWMRDVQEIASNGTLCAYFGLPTTVIADLTKELIAGAQRLQLEDRIATVARTSMGFRMKFEHLVMLPARLSANILNGYLSFLGYDTVDLLQRPMVLGDESPQPIFPPRMVPRGGPILEEQPATYDQDYYTDWIRGFLDVVDRNARCRNGITVDVAANRQLGGLLGRLGARS